MNIINLKVMRVAHIFWSLGYGGIETMLVNIANAQVDMGAEVHIVIINHLMEKSLVDNLDERIHYHCLERTSKSKSLWFFVKLNQLLLKINPDAIHLHRSEFYSILFSKKLKRISCVTLHDLPSGKVRRAMSIARLFPILNFHMAGNVSCINLVPRVFSISNSVQKALFDNYGVKSTVIENGIITKKFQQRDSSTINDNSPLRVICVSRLEHEKKGQDLLIEAAKKLNGKADVSFVGIGNSMESLKDLTHKLNADKYVHFLGKEPQSWIAEHLRDYDLFVQASRWEGFGLTVAEAMAAKLPVLVSSGQGPAEVTENDKFGWVFKNGNSNDLANEIKYIASHYEKALTKADKAVQHVRKNYDVSVTAKSYLEHYLEN